jgi:hypothetical protein
MKNVKPSGFQLGWNGKYGALQRDGRQYSTTYSSQLLFFCWTRFDVITTYIFFPVMFCQPSFLKSRVARQIRHWNHSI